MVLADRKVKTFQKADATRLSTERHKLYSHLGFAYEKTILSMGAVHYILTPDQKAQQERKLGQNK